MTKQDSEQDFASAAMMRLAIAGSARQGISVPLRSPSGAHVPRSQKREVLDAVLTAHGPLAILSIADAARQTPPEPVAQALLRARDTGDLLDRWHRLERFSHGRHRIEVRRLGEDSFQLTHHARDAGPPPSPAESLLVLGLLTTLAEMIGSADVSLVSSTGEIWRENGAWRAPTRTPPTGSAVLSALPMPRAACRNASIPVKDPIEGLRQHLVADPVRRWTLADLASAAGASPRTLQRRLAEKSVSFTRLVSETRLQVAASHLCDANGPGLAEIGFLAGFSDQAHFARSFSHAVGTTPSAYRADFSR